jgi:hypothetical protein
MKEGRLPPRLLFGRIEGKSQRGRPVGRWRDMVEGDLKRRNVKSSWYNIVQDRAKWRRVVHGESAVAVRGVRKKGEKESTRKQIPRGNG